MSRASQSCLPVVAALVVGVGMGCSGTSEPPASAGARAPDPSASVARVRVFAAASTTQALQAVLRAHEAAGGPPADAVVASSSTLARQIEQGAPADLFLSANPRWMDHLEAGGHIGADTRRDLLGNRLVVVAPAAAPEHLALTASTDLVARLAGSRLAVGDPDHVPAGLYAKAALEGLGLWDQVEPHLARSADVRAALALVERGEAPLGIVYATDAAASDSVVVVATFPVGSHPPVTYPLAIVAERGEQPGVQAVWSHLQSDAAQAVFAEYGFIRP